MLELLLKANPEEPDFYRDLYELTRNPIFSTFEAKSFALHWILIDKRIPYFKLPQGLRMTNDDWDRLREKLHLECALIRFILNAELQQNSERADLLLQVLDRHEGLERIRLLGIVIWELEGEERRRARALAAALK